MLDRWEDNFVSWQLFILTRWKLDTRSLLSLLNNLLVHLWSWIFMWWIADFSFHSLTFLMHVEDRTVLWLLSSYSPLIEVSTGLLFAKFYEVRKLFTYNAHLFNGDRKLWKLVRIHCYFGVCQFNFVVSILDFTFFEHLLA